MRNARCSSRSRRTGQPADRRRIDYALESGYIAANHLPISSKRSFSRARLAENHTQLHERSTGFFRFSEWIRDCLQATAAQRIGAGLQMSPELRQLLAKIVLGERERVATDQL